MEQNIRRERGRKHKKTVGRGSRIGVGFRVVSPLLRHVTGGILVCYEFRALSNQLDRIPRSVNILAAPTPDVLPSLYWFFPNMRAKPNRLVLLGGVLLLAPVPLVTAHGMLG